MDIVDAIIPAPNNDIDALHPSLEPGQQRFQRVQVVPVDDYVPIRVIPIGILLLQHPERHIQMMIDNLVLPNPVQRRHPVHSPSFRLSNSYYSKVFLRLQ